MSFITHSFVIIRSNGRNVGQTEQPQGTHYDSWNTGLTSELCQALCELTNLKTLLLIHFVGWDADLLKTLVSGLKLEEIFIGCAGNIQFDWIETVVKYSRSLEKMEIESIFHDEPLQGTHYLQLVNARKESGAGFPLEIKSNHILLK